MPESYRNEILRVGHTIPLSGHMGSKKTFDQIAAHFSWPGLSFWCTQILCNLSSMSVGSQEIKVKKSTFKTWWKTLPSLLRRYRYRHRWWITYNPGQKYLVQYCNMHIFLSLLGSLLKQCIIFEIFLHFSLPPTLYKVETWKKLWIHASNIVCGVRAGFGPVWIGKRPRNAKVSQDFCPWL